MAQLKIRYLLIIVPLAFSMGQAKAQDSSLVSQSLVEKTVIAPNGAVTVEGVLAVNQLMGGDKKVAHEITNGVYHIRGWGIAHTIAIDAPEGWIIVDTGDSTKTASEMRQRLEKKVGKKIKGLFPKSSG